MNLSDRQRETLGIMTSGDHLEGMTSKQAFAYGVALGTFLADPPLLESVKGGYQDAFRPLVDDLSSDITEALGYAPWD